MAWVLRGLRDGVVTSRYPRRPDGYGDGYRAALSVVEGADAAAVDGHLGEKAALASLCPTGAIEVGGSA